VEKCVNHDVVVKLEDLERMDCSEEVNQRKRKQREFCYIVGVERRHRASKKRSRVTSAKVVENIRCGGDGVGIVDGKILGSKDW